MNEIQAFVDKIIEFLEAAGGKDVIALMDLPSPIFSAIVIVTLDAPVMIDSIADTLIEEFGGEAFEVFGVRGREEGIPESGWVLVDFGEVVVHLFLPEVREYYAIERLWGLELLKSKREKRSFEGDKEL